MPFAVDATGCASAVFERTAAPAPAAAPVVTKSRRLRAFVWSDFASRFLAISIPLTCAKDKVQSRHFITAAPRALRARANPYAHLHVEDPGGINVPIFDHR